jgi:uncharacterized damage-inducible protein DinB
MMTSDRDVLKEALSSQFDFHFAETRRLLELARRLPQAQFSARHQYSSGGLQATFAHILGSDRFWRGVLTGSGDPAEAEVDEASLEGLIAWNEAERACWNAFMAALDDGQLVASYERDLPFGSFSFTLGQALQHVILHGHQHHTEIAQLLTEAGHSPGDVDYFDYVALRRGE